MIIDTHVHLDDERYNDDFDEMLQRARVEGVKYFIIPGAHPDTLQRAIELSEKYDEIYFAVGVHPNDHKNFKNFKIDHYITHPKCIAIGECGLDYYRLDGTDLENQMEKNAQFEIFRAQIKLAIAHKKPLIVHIRDASRDAKRILIEENASLVGGVLHCFNADEELLDLANKGFYFGIGGVLTFQNAKKLINVLPKIPNDKLVIETDGPYLTPHPYRGKRNESAYTRLVVKKLSELKSISEEDIENITSQNSLRLFSGIQ